MIEKVIIGFMLGFFAGLGNNKAKENFNEKLTFWEIVIPSASIVFTIHSFTYGFGFGLMAIAEIIIGASIGKKVIDILK